MASFYTGKGPYKGLKPYKFSQSEDLAERLRTEVREFNEAQQNRDGGLRCLRSLLSHVVWNPAWNAGKQILHALNSKDPARSLPLAKALVSQVYDTADEQFVMGQISAFVSKYPFSGLREVAERNGLLKFHRGERRNRHMNALIRARRDQHAEHDLHWSMLSMRRYIRRVIGDEPQWDKLISMADWGPGSNVGVTGRFTNFARKLLSDEWTVTLACYPRAIYLARRLPMFWDVLGLTRVVTYPDGTNMTYYCVDHDEFGRRFQAKVRFVDYNKVSLAKKKADEDRTIASEPLLNQLVQKAFDEYLKESLRKWGHDLKDQSINQALAREGSLGGFNPRCTIDLKNASGSICRELPYDCLPRGWWEAFEATRSPCYKIGEDDPMEYHGFVSMGNGFCFPLETLIFAAICNAAHEYTHSKPDFRCYGDDLVVRQSEALVTLELLRRYGFAANPDKTFIFGPFRESCGADWHGGVDVRPAYLDDDLSLLEHRIRAHNAFVRRASPWAAYLASCLNHSFPSFCKWFIRPWADETDEAIDGRFLATQPELSLNWNYSIQCPTWYGLVFTAREDREIREHPLFATAEYHAALKGASSEMPFAERRETSVRVARFSHSGARSTWEPKHQVQSNMDRVSSHLLQVFTGALVGELYA